MFGTIILDSYSNRETENLAAAIDDLCSPKDSYGWSSSGIYSFWDFETKEILYIGLASDLSNRFKQHNGLISESNRGNKYTEITNYFR